MNTSVPHEKVVFVEHTRGMPGPAPGTRALFVNRSTALAPTDTLVIVTAPRPVQITLAPITERDDTGSTKRVQDVSMVCSTAGVTHVVVPAAGDGLSSGYASMRLGRGTTRLLGVNNVWYA